MLKHFVTFSLRDSIRDQSMNVIVSHKKNNYLTINLKLIIQEAFNLSLDLDFSEFISRNQSLILYYMYRLDIFWKLLIGYDLFR